MEHGDFFLPFLNYLNHILLSAHRKPVTGHKQPLREFSMKKGGRILFHTHSIKDGSLASFVFPC